MAINNEGKMTLEEICLEIIATIDKDLADNNVNNYSLLNKELTPLLNTKLQKLNNSAEMSAELRALIDRVYSVTKDAEFKRYDPSVAFEIAQYQVRLSGILKPEERETIMGYLSLNDDLTGLTNEVKIKRLRDDCGYFSGSRYSVTGQFTDKWNRTKNTSCNVIVMIDSEQYKVEMDSEMSISADYEWDEQGVKRTNVKRQIQRSDDIDVTDLVLTHIWSATMSMSYEDGLGNPVTDISCEFGEKNTYTVPEGFSILTNPIGNLTLKEVTVSKAPKEIVAPTG